MNSFKVVLKGFQTNSPRIAHQRIIVDTSMDRAFQTKNFIYFFFQHSFKIVEQNSSNEGLIASTNSTVDTSIDKTVKNVNIFISSSQIGSK